MVVYEGENGAVAGHYGTCIAVARNAAKFNFEEFGNVTFDTAGYGENNLVAVQLRQEYGRYFCIVADCGGFRDWISELGTLTEKAVELPEPEPSTWLATVASWNLYVAGAFDSVVQTIYGSALLPDGFATPFVWIRDAFESLAGWFGVGDDWVQGVQRWNSEVVDHITDIWNWQGVVWAWKEGIDTWWGEVVELVSDFSAKVRGVVSTEILRIDYLWDNLPKEVRKALGSDWTDLLELKKNFITDVNKLITAALPDLDAWLDEQKDRVWGWIQVHKPDFLGWIDEKKEEIQNWSEERILSLGSDAKDAIYGFVDERVDDLWESIRGVIDRTVEKHAQWWWNLMEKILKKL